MTGLILAIQDENRRTMRRTPAYRVRDDMRRAYEGTSKNWRFKHTCDRAGRDSSLLSRGSEDSVFARYKILGRELAKAIAASEISEVIAVLNANDEAFSTFTPLVDSSIAAVLREKGFWARRCEECDDWVDNNNTVYTHYDTIICDTCCSRFYHYSERRDAYVLDNDDNSDYDDSGYENIGEYHSSRERLGHIASEYDNRKPRVLLGLELEVEVASGYDKDDKAGELWDAVGEYKDEPYALCEEDGSLDNGFEMVTAYTGLDVHARQLSALKNNTIAGLKSHDTQTCGLHVHICKSDMSTLHAAKMVLFINNDANRELVNAIARRDSEGWAKLKDKNNDREWLTHSLAYKDKKRQLLYLNTSRYEALNFNNPKTVEFRLFRGTLRYETIMACLEFTYATWFFCREASAQELTTKRFLDFIVRPENKKDTKHLRAYLIAKGLL